MSFFEPIHQWVQNNISSQPLYQLRQSYASNSNFVIAPFIFLLALPIIAILGICSCIFGNRGTYVEPSYSGTNTFASPFCTSSWGSMHRHGLPIQPSVSHACSYPTTIPAYQASPILPSTTSNGYNRSNQTCAMSGGDHFPAPSTSYSGGGNMSVGMR